MQTDVETFKLDLYIHIILETTVILEYHQVREFPAKYGDYSPRVFGRRIKTFDRSTFTQVSGLIHTYFIRPDDYVVGSHDSHFDSFDSAWLGCCICILNTLVHAFSFASFRYMRV